MSDTPGYSSQGGFYGGGGQFPAPGPNNYAQWTDRVVAAIIDWLLASAVALVLYIIFTIIGVGLGALGDAASRGGADAASGILGALSCGVCCFWVGLPAGSYLAVGLYNKVYLVGNRGYSIGQGVMKLAVVTDTGSLVPRNPLILRLLVQFAFSLIWPVAVLDGLWPLWDEKRQTLHDKAVNTYVIKVG